MFQESHKMFGAIPYQDCYENPSDTNPIFFGLEQFNLFFNARVNLQYRWHYSNTKISVKSLN